MRARLAVRTRSQVQRSMALSTSIGIACAGEARISGVMNGMRWILMWRSASTGPP